MAFFSCPRFYVQDASDISDKITRLQNIINALEDAALLAASGQDIAEYSLDDGQTKIRNVYRSGEEMAKAIDAFERILQRYINRYNGPQYRLMDHESVKHAGSRFV